MKHDMKKIKLRKQRERLRKNFLPTLVLIVLLWTSLGALVYFTDPNTTGVIFIFFFLAFLALLFTSSTIFANTRRGLLTSLGLTLFIILRYFGVGNIINFLLILGLIIVSEIYLSKE